MKEDGEEVGGRRRGRRRDGSRGSGRPGFPERPNDPDVQLQRWLLGELQIIRPLAAPPLDRVRWGGKNWREKRREAGSERNLRKREI